MARESWRRSVSSSGVGLRLPALWPSRGAGEGRVCTRVSHRHEVLALPARRGLASVHVSRWGAGGQHSQTRGRLFPGTEKGPPAQPSQARPLVSRGPARGLGMQRGHEAIGPSEGPQGAPSPPSPSCHLSSLDHPGAGAPRTPPSGLRPPDDPACTPRPLSGPHPGPAAGHVASGPEPLTAPRGTETLSAWGRRGLEPQAPGACRTRPAVTERPAPRQPHTAAVLPSWLHPQDGRLCSPASPGEEAAVPAMWAQGGVSARLGP